MFFGQRPAAQVGVLVRDHVEAPDLLAGLRVQCDDEAAGAGVAAGGAGDHHPVVVRGRVGEVVPVLVVRDRLLPHDATCGLVEGGDGRVTEGEVHLAVALSHAAARQERRQTLRELGLPAPEPLAGSGVQRPHVPVGVGHVHRALVDDGLLLGEDAERARLHLEARDDEALRPRDLELLDVRGVDGVERRIALVVDVPVPAQPVVPRGGDQIARRESRGRNRRRPVTSRGDEETNRETAHGGDGHEHRHATQFHGPSFEFTDVAEAASLTPSHARAKGTTVDRGMKW